MRLLIFLIQILVVGVASAQTPTPSLRIDSLLEAARSGGSTPAQRIGAAADFMIGSSYESTAHLDPPQGNMRVDLNSMDEMEFIEYALAAAIASFEPAPRPSDFEKALADFRYRRGENTGFTSRLRYTSDWIAANCYRNALQEITFDLPGNISTARTLDHITRNKDRYPALADSMTLDRMQMLEMGFRVHKIPYMKSQAIGKKAVVDMLRDNDIIIILDRSSDSDFLDAGFIRFIEGVPHLLHASRTAGKVTIESESLQDVFKLKAKQTGGFRILRVKGN